MRYAVGVIAVSLHSALESLETSQSEERIEGARISAHRFSSHVELLVQIVAVGDKSAHDEIGVASDVLGERVGNDVRA